MKSDQKGDGEEADASFIPVNHLAEIGRIANAWATLEFSVDRVTWAVLGVHDSTGACLTAQMLSIQPKLRALIALCELLEFDSGVIADLKRFNSKTISGLQERRNRAVHDARMIQERTGEVHRLQITAQGSLVFGMQPEPLEMLKETRRKIEDAINQFFDLRDRVLAEFQTFLTSPERQQLRLLKIQSVRPGTQADPNGEQ